MAELKPLIIGDVQIPNKLVLAPMAGVNCTSFRLLCKESGAGLIYTQMYHADFLCHKLEVEGERAVFDYINIQPEERPVTIQLVGHDPVKMLQAAKVIEKIADIIDINLGCCDLGMIKSGAGGYYAQHVEKIEPLIVPIIKNCKKPVTAKIRIGWDAQSINGVAVAGMLEKIGVASVAVHGRVVTQKYAGKSNWQIIKHIKQKLTIPVIGNGDVNNKMKAKEMLDLTCCDLVMIGRRTMGDPGFFTRCKNLLYVVSEDIIDTKVLFAKFMGYYEKYDKDKSFTELRTHAQWFAKRACLGPRLRNEIMQTKTVDELKQKFFEIDS